MKPVRQTIVGMPSGNCLAACVASIFELPIWLVPNFGMLDQWQRKCGGWIRVGDAEDVPRWWSRLCDFAQEQGWRTLQLNARQAGAYGGRFLIGDLAIATVRSPRGDWDHCVVANIANGQVEWDPHPEGWPEGHQLLARDVSDWILFVALK